LDILWKTHVKKLLKLSAATFFFLKGNPATANFLLMVGYPVRTVGK